MTAMQLSWSRVPPSIRRGIAQIPLSRLACTVARGASSNRLRVLALHGVPDLDRFEVLLDEVLADYSPVSSSDVRDALERDIGLPRFPVWFTFDDGLPSTFAAGQALADRGIRATAFVCPGVLDSDRHLWFQAWERCDELNLLGRPGDQDRFALSRLKTLPDSDRRAETDVLLVRLSEAGDRPPMQATQAMLERWVSQGHDIGNHTWDHPMLDRCSPETSRDQVAASHRALEERGFAASVLAYPNGNWSQSAEGAARELGYVGSLLFDHRLTTLDGNPHRLSRLRLDSDASSRRTASVLSGAHSTALHLMPRI